MPHALPPSLFACLLVLGAVLGAVPGAVLPGGDPYFLLRPRLESADAVVVGMVRSTKDVKKVLRPRDRIAVIELSGLWKGGNPEQAPETIVVHGWDGPEPDPSRRTPWVFFLSRNGNKEHNTYGLQATVDLSLLSDGQRDVFRERVQQFVGIGLRRKAAASRRATVSWLMVQARDPVSREGATFDLERPAFYSLLTGAQVTVLQDLYCSLDKFDVTAGHLTDILDVVATDRARFVRCAFQLLQGQVERATWIEASLVSVIEQGLTCDEITTLAEEYRATHPISLMRGFEDSAERRVTRRDVLRRLCDVAQRELDAVPEGEGDTGTDATAASAEDAAVSEAIVEVLADG